MLAKHADKPGALGPVEMFMAAIAAVPRAAQRLQAARLQRSFAERLSNAQARTAVCVSALLQMSEPLEGWPCLTAAGPARLSMTNRVGVGVYHQPAAPDASHAGYSLVLCLQSGVQLLSEACHEIRGSEYLRHVLQIALVTGTPPIRPPLTLQLHSFSFDISERWPLDSPMDLSSWRFSCCERSCAWGAAL